MTASSPPFTNLDFDHLARDWLRALRGGRSQVALSRRLGYRTNIAYRWEAGQCFPTAARTLQLIDKLGVDVEAALGSFVHLEGDWLGSAPLLSPQAVAAWLRQLTAGIPTKLLAERADVSRYRVTRWLGGNCEPKLPDLLRFLEAATGRALDFIACFSDPEQLPCARGRWRDLVEARELAYRLPWSHAVLRVLELDAYRALPQHDSNWIATRLGAPQYAVDEALAALLRLGQVHRGPTHYAEVAPDNVDTRADPERALQLKAWWATRAVERLSAGQPGLFSFNLSAVSRADLERLQQIQRRAYREMSRIIAESSPAECVVVHSAQLLALD